jgi:myo-inositol-1(or 4)-monophosphatase
VTDWLAICRDATDDVRGVLTELPTRDEREPVLARGVGGDDTTAIDAAAERAVVERLDREGLDFTLVSEELGQRPARGDGEVVVVLDPIDGSINAKRGIPFFALSIAVAVGPAMGDVVFGFVHDFGSGEEWTAHRGGGALLDGEPLGSVYPKEHIELLSLEATRTDLVARHVAPFVGIAHRLRIMGSLALSLCHLAAGRVDGVCSLKPARSVDIAAAQLVVRERGLAIDLPDAGPYEQAPLDLEGRSRVVGGAKPERRAPRVVRPVCGTARPTALLGLVIRLRV